MLAETGMGQTIQNYVIGKSCRILSRQVKALIYINCNTFVVSWRMDWREPRANVGESCSEFIAVFQVDRMMVVYRMVVEDFEKSR